MGPGAVMGVFLGILAVVIIGAFATVWLRDRGRAHEVSDDEGRLDTDSTQKNRPRGR